MEAKLYYPNMQNFMMEVSGEKILCDGEGYLLDLEAWSEDYVHASENVKSWSLMTSTGK